MSKRTATRAQLDQDPVRQSARRQERSAAFSRDMATSQLEKRALAAEDAKLRLEDELRQRDVKIRALESDRRELADRELAATETKNQEAAQWREEKTKMDEQLRELQRVQAELSDERDDLIDEHADLKRKYNTVNDKLFAHSSASARNIKALQDQLAAAKEDAAERLADVQLLQAQLDETIASKTEAIRRAQDELNSKILREELHKQLASFKKLEAENARLHADLRVLRPRAQQTEVLREEKLALEKRLHHAEGFREQAARLQAEVDAARAERAQWAKQNQSTPSSVVNELTSVRLQYASLLESQGSLKVELREREALLVAAEASSEQAEQLVSTLRGRVVELEDAVTKRERRITLADQEVQFLNALVATYDAEQAADAEEDGDTKDGTSEQRIQHLTKLVDDYKTECRELEQQIRNLKQSVSTQPAAFTASATAVLADEASEALVEAQKVITNHEAAIDKLQQEIFELRGTVAQGNLVPPGKRVLELAENPLTLWAEMQQSNLDRLKNENTALLMRLAELEQQGAAAESVLSLVPRDSLERAQGETDQLKDELAKKEKRFDRLSKVFHAKSKEFKDAVSMLIGYKLTFDPDGVVRVRSIYDVSAWFVFGPEEDDPTKMVLREGGVVPGLDMEDVRNNYLGRSIPCFLAAITIECQDRFGR